MAEISFPWGAHSVGDATIAPYSDQEFSSDFFRFFFTYDRATEGVVDTGDPAYTGGLVVNGAAASVNVQTGVAMVDGTMYKNSAVVNVAIPTPVTLTRIDRIVLRKDFAAQTVRITRIPGVEGAPATALTQNSTYWDISLAVVSVSILGVITVTNNARAIRSPLGPGYQYSGLAADIAGGFSTVAWNTITSITLGPGKWLMWGSLGFNNSVITGGSRYVRIYNVTQGVQVATGSGIYPAGGGDMSINVRPGTPIDIGTIQVFELQFFTVSAADSVYGDTNNTPVNDSTGIVAMRVI